MADDSKSRTHREKKRLENVKGGSNQGLDGGR